MADLPDSDFEDDDEPTPKMAPLSPERRADLAIAAAVEFATEKMTTSEMVDHIDAETHRIEGEQRARLLAGLLVEPSPEQIDRIARNHVVLKFLKACAERPGEAAEHFRRLAQRQRGQ